MAAKKKAVKAGTGAYAAGKAAGKNQYVQRVIEDPELRENLRSGYESARKAYSRMNGKAPTKALDNKKVRKDLADAATSFRDAADALREQPKRKKRRRKGGLVGLVLVGAVAAVVISEDLRKKILDALFGAEEEFEYTSTTTPAPVDAPAPETAGA